MQKQTKVELRILLQNFNPKEKNTVFEKQLAQKAFYVRNLGILTDSSSTLSPIVSATTAAKLKDGFGAGYPPTLSLSL